MSPNLKVRLHGNGLTDECKCVTNTKAASVNTYAQIRNCLDNLYCFDGEQFLLSWISLVETIKTWENLSTPSDFVQLVLQMSSEYLSHQFMYTHFAPTSGKRILSKFLLN